MLIIATNINSLTMMFFNFYGKTDTKLVCTLLYQFFENQVIKNYFHMTLVLSHHEIWKVLARANHTSLVVKVH